MMELNYDTYIIVRMRSAEKKKIEQQAYKNSQTISEYIRQLAAKDCRGE